MNTLTHVGNLFAFIGGLVPVWNGYHGIRTSKDSRK
mgnify:CR=1 FL=1